MYDYFDELEARKLVSLVGTEAMVFGICAMCKLNTNNIEFVQSCVAGGNHHGFRLVLV